MMYSTQITHQMMGIAITGKLDIWNKINIIPGYIEHA